MMKIADIAECAQRFKNGTFIGEMAREHGISYMTMRTALMRYMGDEYAETSLPHRAHGNRATFAVADNIDDILEAWERGYTYRAIGARYYCSHNTVKEIVHRYRTPEQIAAHKTMYSYNPAFEGNDFAPKGMPRKKLGKRNAAHGSCKHGRDWHRLVQEIKDAADWKCEVCGRQCYRPNEKAETMSAVLVVGHRDGDKDNNERENLMPLCTQCHMRYEAQWRAKRREDAHKGGETACGTSSDVRTADT